MTFAPRTFVVGEVVSAAVMNQEIRDQFNSMFAAWTSYTPVWTASTTNPVLDNGTLIGRYMKIGRTVYFHINLTTGSLTTYGSGVYSFSLPVASANAGATMIGNAHLLAGSRWNGQLVISANATTTSPFFPTNSTTTSTQQQTATIPATLAAGHQLRMTGMYEAAA
ncbi:hypothetical protein CLM62_12900 [Streptomyces sp. SA15]|uniref:hypothetical protein n=1 Tax=Streptomyces sp. SA15 TaxID=934019 RepID=UPI000BAF9703|nr:hypothetical protein [Streptomyces sp. SA15]PAZ15689.1 hypothetical protein CLM62_12900 [Streptomyces sp. SA15]